MLLWQSIMLKQPLTVSCDFKSRASVIQILYELHYNLTLITYAKRKTMITE